MEFKETNLWKTTLGHQGKSEKETTATKRLSASYDLFYDRASTLASRISSDLPDLTLHDKDHFNALWEMVDVLVGDDHDLNPLEMFILGGAILLHDTANTVAAYDGGFEEVKATPQWKDAEAEILNGKDDAEKVLSTTDEKLVLLFTLRHIHAERAAEMHEFFVESKGEKLFLIDDSDLRKSLGELIGRIAASHHWGVDELVNNLRSEVGPPSNMPSNWVVRPVLLACILRCADACQVDASRAPAFLQGLIRPSEGSLPHWDAQASLNKPTIMSDDSETLLFTSSSDFGPDAAKAWWIANDLIRNADKELSACDALLRDLNLPELNVRRIAGAKSPRRLSHFVKVVGWHPVDAKVTVSDVGRVVDLFGGDKLYGNSVLIPLRELIQNAADAVRLRRALDEGDTPYNGQITIRVRKNDNGQFLEVDDDGIGMSQDVLTGPLIDFTSSYLTSSIAKREYPGLAGRRTRRSGRYGVGFFSTFMLSDHVSVTSRPFDKAPSDARTLKFEDGLAVRPVLIEETPKGYSVATSTRVTVPISDDQLLDMRTIRKNHVTDEATYTTLERVIANLAPLLDVDVYLNDLGASSKVHAANWHETDSLVWLKQIDLEESKEESAYSTTLEKIAGAVDFIDSERPFLGRAVIAPMAGNGNYTVDGLNSPRMMGQAHNEFCGVIDRPSSGPRRQPNKWIDKVAIANWASRQAQKLAVCELENIQKYYAACRVANYGGDTFPIATICLNGEWVEINTAYEKLKEGSLFAPIDSKGSNGGWKLSKIRLKRPYISYGISRDNFKQNEQVIEARSNSNNERYLSVLEEGKRDNLSFVSLLSRLASEDGHEIMTEGIDDFPLAKYTGEESRLEKFTTGMDMIMPVLKISLVKSDDTKTK